MMMRCFISFMLYNYCPTLRSPFEIKSISPHIKEKAKNQSPGIIFEQPFYARVAHTSCITAIVGKRPRGLFRVRNITGEVTQPIYEVPEGAVADAAGVVVGVGPLLLLEEVVLTISALYL